jgi:hypothetical protein
MLPMLALQHLSRHTALGVSGIDGKIRRVRFDNTLEQTDSNHRTALVADYL